MHLIDAHNHPDWHGHDLSAALADMDRLGIEKTWLLSWECPTTDYSPAQTHLFPAPTLGSPTGPIPFSRCLSYKERAPERFVLGYAPDPRDPQACRKLVAAHRIYGACLCGEVKIRAMYDSPDCLRLFRTAGELGMPVTLHFDYDFRLVHDALYAPESAQASELPWSAWYGGTIDTLERVLQACPETVFLGHAPGFWIHIADDDLWRTVPYPPDGAPVAKEGRIATLLRKYPNLHCDISAGSGRRALSRDPEYARRFLTEFQDRICYARDCYDNQHREFLDSLGLPRKILAKIYAENALSLLEGRKS